MDRGSSFFMSSFVKVAMLQEVPEDAGKCVSVAGHEIALFRIGTQCYAIAGRCPHRGGPLAEGDLSGTVLTCPWHHWQFDVTTGKCPTNPTIGVACYPVKVEGEEVWIAPGPVAE